MVGSFFHSGASFSGFGVSGDSVFGDSGALCCDSLGESVCMSVGKWGLAGWLGVLGLVVKASGLVLGQLW